MLDKETRYPGVELNHSVNLQLFEAILIQENTLNQLQLVKYVNYISVKHTLKHLCNSNTLLLCDSKVSFLYEYKYKNFSME